MTIQRKALGLCLAFAVVVAVVYVAVGFPIVAAPWYVRGMYSVAATLAGGLGGLAIGLLIGAIGLAISGGAIPVAGWLACGLIGAGTGSIVGNVALLVLNPATVSIRSAGLFVGIVCAAALAACVHALSTGWWRTIATRLAG
jgi:hypothetical protein